MVVPSGWFSNRTEQNRTRVLADPELIPPGSGNHWRSGSAALLLLTAPLIVPAADGAGHYGGSSVSVRQHHPSGGLHRDDVDDRLCTTPSSGRPSG